MITYKIYGMHVRDEMIDNLKEKLQLSNDDVYYEDRLNGGLALYTAKKAWLAPIEDGETHRVVFPDDVDVCNGFKDICEKIVKTHPDCIISLPLWRGRKKCKELENLHSPYVKTNLVIGWGIIMPIKYIDDCFSYIKEEFNDDIADDYGIQLWAQKNRIPIISTIPCLVQHLGDISLLDPSLPIRQSAYFEENPIADWENCEIITLPSPSARFAPYKKELFYR